MNFGHLVVSCLFLFLYTQAAIPCKFPCESVNATGCSRGYCNTATGNCVYTDVTNNVHCKDFEGEDGKCVFNFCAVPVGQGKRVLHGKQDSTKNNKFYYKDLVIDRPFEFHCQQQDIAYNTLYQLTNVNPNLAAHLYSFESPWLARELRNNNTMSFWATAQENWRNISDQPNTLLFHFYRDEYSFMAREYEQLAPLSNTSFLTPKFILSPTQAEPKFVYTQEQKEGFNSRRGDDFFLYVRLMAKTEESLRRLSLNITESPLPNYDLFIGDQKKLKLVTPSAATFLSPDQSLPVSAELFTQLRDKSSYYYGEFYGMSMSVGGGLKRMDEQGQEEYQLFFERGEIKEIGPRDVIEGHFKNLRYSIRLLPNEHRVFRVTQKLLPDFPNPLILMNLTKRYPSLQIFIAHDQCENGLPYAQSFEIVYPSKNWTGGDVPTLILDNEKREQSTFDEEGEFRSYWCMTFQNSDRSNALTVNFNFLEIPDPKFPGENGGPNKLSYFYLLIPVAVLFGVILVVVLIFGRKKLAVRNAGGIVQSFEFDDEPRISSSAHKYELVNSGRPSTTFADENKSSFTSSSEQ